MARIWRLSAQQYANTARQFGVTVDKGALPPDLIRNEALTRFDTNSDLGLVDDRMAVVLADQSNKLADAVLASAATATPCVTAAEDAACVRTFLGGVASRAYRRPVTGGELDRLVSFKTSSAASFGARIGLHMTLEAIFQSPHFLYRSELGESQGPRVGLTQYELASQISYLLTDGPPDAALLQAAASAQLTNPATVRAHAQRLLTTPGARSKLRAFFTSYLSLDAITADDGPGGSLAPTLRSALVEETGTFIEKVAFDENGSLASLYGAGHSYLTATTARHYGLESTGTAPIKTTLPSGRAGLLTQAAVLASVSSGTKTSPVHRGLLFVQSMLCRALPPPPQDASDDTGKLTDPANPNGTERQQWSYFSRAFPACASCHNVFHPLGLSLENFDSVGRYRRVYAGNPIDPSATLAGYGPDVDGAYPDGVALGKAVAASKIGRECAALQYLTFAFGRSVDTEADQCRLEALGRRLGEPTGGIQSFLVGLTEDETFYFRTYEEPRK